MVVERPETDAARGLELLHLARSDASLIDKLEAETEREEPRRPKKTRVTRQKRRTRGPAARLNSNQQSPQK